MFYSNFILIDENSLRHPPPSLPFLGAPGISWDPTCAVGINIIIIAIILPIINVIVIVVINLLSIIISITEEITTCYNSNGININRIFGGILTLSYSHQMSTNHSLSLIGDRKNLFLVDATHYQLHERSKINSQKRYNNNTFF